MHALQREGDEKPKTVCEDGIFSAPLTWGSVSDISEKNISEIQN